MEILERNQWYMRQALQQAQEAEKDEEVPVGAIITFEDRIIARAHNQVEMLRDPTAHAEMIAITQATHALSTKWLLDCTMYVTMEPCPMCAGALVLSRLKQLFFGASDPKSGACGSVVNIAEHNRLNHRLEIHRGLLSKECGELVTMFFQKKR